MFSSAKKINAIAIILTAANGVATFLFMLYILGLGLDFAVIFTVLLYLLTSTGVSIVICFNIHGLCQDLQLDSDSTADRINRLSKRVKELEDLRK